MSPTTSVTPQVVAEDEWTLDISITASGPIVPELMRSTDDGCGKTCGSACTSCKS